VSRTKRGFQQAGRGEGSRLYLGQEWWGKRPLAYHAVSFRPRTNKFFKRLLHRIERRQGKEQIEEMQEDIQ